MDRRDFIKTTAASVTVCALPEIQLAENPHPNMTLFSITDRERIDSYGDYGWCVAIWAMTELQAIKHAYRNYSGDCHPDEADLWCVSEQEQGGKFAPLTNETTHHEQRWSMLRLAGWQEEGEYACDCCGLFSMGMEEFSVCPDCYICKECGCDCEG